MQREYRRVNANGPVIKAQKAKAAARANVYYHANKEAAMAYRLRVRQNPEFALKAAERCRKYYEANKAKMLLWQKEYNRKNALAVKSRSRDAYARNRDAIVARAIAWAAANPDRVIQAGRLRREANPEKYRTYHRNRRARKIAAGGQLSRDLALRLYAQQDGKCACCGEPLNGKYHMDHIMPLVLGGSNSDENIQLLTPRCNMEKGAMHPEEFKRLRASQRHQEGWR